MGSKIFQLKGLEIIASFTSLRHVGLQISYFFGFLYCFNYRFRLSARFSTSLL
jgi:hypothetical protein